MMRKAEVGSWEGGRRILRGGRSGRLYSSAFSSNRSARKLVREILHETSWAEELEVITLESLRIAQRYSQYVS